MSNEESVAGINVRKLRNEKLMLQDQLALSCMLVKAARTEIAQLEEALKNAHQLLEVISIDSRYPSLGVSVKSFLRRERATLSSKENAGG